MVVSLISTKASEKQQQVLQSFAEQRPDQLAAGDLDAHVDKYDFKSENVIELLKQLKLKFEDDKLAGTKAETNSVNAYEVAKEARDNAIDAAKKAKGKKEKKLASVEKDIAQAEKELKSTQDDLKADSKSLKETEEACNTKKEEWETRSETRTLELEAMDQAIKILAKSAGVRTEAPGNPIPPPSPVSFLQLSKDQTNDPKMKAVALLKEAAQDTHSQALERLAVQVAAHLSGPFDDVNNMIEKMIFRLMDEQKQEDEHKDWCDEEIMKTEVMREDKNQKIKDLALEIRLATSKGTSLEGRINRTNDDISAIVTFVKEATEIRQIGKRENKLALKDAQDAQTALTNAISVIEAFYKDSGKIPKELWEFIQRTPVKLASDPPTWSDSGAKYEAVAGAGSQPEGILSELEKVLSDFSQMEAQTKSQQARNQKAYSQSLKKCCP